MMMAKPIKTLETNYLVIQFLITIIITEYYNFEQTILQFLS